MGGAIPQSRIVEKLTRSLRGARTSSPHAVVTVFLCLRAAVETPSLPIHSSSRFLLLLSLRAAEDSASVCLRGPLSCIHENITKAPRGVSAAKIFY